MDPLSFTASLATVAALATATSKNIYDLRKKLISAPKDVENLLEQLRTFESLLKELKTQLQDHRNGAPPQETLPQVWGESMIHMQRDMQSLRTVLSKIEPLLEKKSRISRIMLLARQNLSEKEVEKYRRNIDTHCGTLTNIQAMVCSRKLDKLSKDVVQNADEDRAAFRSFSSQVSQSTSQRDTEVNFGFSRLSAQLTGTELAHEVRHQAVLAVLNKPAEQDSLITEKLDEVTQQQLASIDINEAGFQAVQSSMIKASSSNLEEHMTTHAMISQCQGQIQQVLRNGITLGTIEHSIHSAPTRPKASDTTTTGAAVLWNHHIHRLTIGMLQISLSRTRQGRTSRRLAPRTCEGSEIAVEFVPPRWLSSFVINYIVQLSWDSIGSQWRWGVTLKPLTVNYNPFFINAVENLDVEGVRKSFETGLAAPTDHIIRLGCDSKPWYQSLRTNDKARCSSMFDYMAKSGLPGQEDFMTMILATINHKDSAYQDYTRKYLHSYSRHGGKIFLRSEWFNFGWFTYKGCIDWISDCLSITSEPWPVDDLSSLEICLIGTIAHADAVFRNRLKRELCSYRSSVSSNGAAFVDHLFETTFGTASIESHFRTLNTDQMYGFLALLSRTGSTSMIKLFISMGYDANGGRFERNLIENAAIRENMDIVCPLLKAGADSSFALVYFLDHSYYLSDASFRRTLEMLVENVEPASTHYFPGPLYAILDSSRARSLCPKAPEMLLNQKVFTEVSLGKEPYRASYYHSYLYRAIADRNPFALDHLLQNGAHADAKMSTSFDCRELFDCRGEWFESCTWITFSVMCGAASCTDVLIRHGADVSAFDGNGRSAVQLATINQLTSHPRCLGHDIGDVFAEEDAETLAVVERAFNLKFMGTRSIEEHIKLGEQFIFQPSIQPDEPASALRRTLKKALGSVLTPDQVRVLHRRLKDIYFDIRKTWSLSFYEALLIRFIYLLSYILVLALEMNAFITGRKRIATPSRSFLSAVALLVLAVVWGPSLTGISWGSIAAGSKSEPGS